MNARAVFVSIRAFNVNARVFCENVSVVYVNVKFHVKAKLIWICMKYFGKKWIFCVKESKGILCKFGSILVCEYELFFNVNKQLMD